MFRIVYLSGLSVKLSVYTFSTWKLWHTTRKAYIVVMFVIFSKLWSMFHTKVAEISVNFHHTKFFIFNYSYLLIIKLKSKYLFHAFLFYLPVCTKNIIPWSRVLEKLIVSQLIKTFLTFYGTVKFLTMFTRAHHWIVSVSVESSPHQFLNPF
jgi:hypothetical protein